MGNQQNRTPWTPEEDRLLCENYSHGPSWEGWSEILPGRSRDSIKSRAVKLRNHGLVFAGSGMGRHVLSRGDADIDPMEPRVVKLHDSGLTVMEIDKRLRMPRGAAREILARRWGRDS